MAIGNISQFDDGSFSFVFRGKLKTEEEKEIKMTELTIRMSKDDAEQFAEFVMFCKEDEEEENQYAELDRKIGGKRG